MGEAVESSRLPGDRREGVVAGMAALDQCGGDRDGEEAGIA